MRIAQVRVELKPLPAGASRDQKDKAFKGMFSAFKKQVNSLGILTEYKEKQVYETKSQKKRRKLKESILQKKVDARLKSRLRENFGSSYEEDGVQPFDK